MSGLRASSLTTSLVLHLAAACSEGSEGGRHIRESGVRRVPRGECSFPSTAQRPSLSGEFSQSVNVDDHRPNHAPRSRARPTESLCRCLRSRTTSASTRWRRARRSRWRTGAARAASRRPSSGATGIQTRCCRRRGSSACRGCSRTPTTARRAGEGRAVIGLLAIVGSGVF